MKKTEKRVAIIGGGICGLLLAYFLSRKNFRVYVFEKSNKLGGLLKTINIEDVPVECYYHHLFLGDNEVLDLIKDLNIQDKLKWYQSKTSLYNNHFYSFSTPLDFLKIPLFSFPAKIRLALAYFYLKKTKNHEKLTKVTARSWIKKWIGNEAWEKLWGPLFIGKFGKFADKIPMSWFWSRVFIRSNSRKRSKEILGYLDGSFKLLIDKLKQEMIKNNGKIKLKSAVISIKPTERGKFEVKTKKINEIYDLVINTIAPSEFAKLVPFEEKYKKRLGSSGYLGVICCLLVCHRKQTNFYWNNILDKKIPFEGIIEHTNLVSSKNYKGNHLIYLVHYCNTQSFHFKLSESKVYKVYLSHLKKIFPQIESEIKKWFIFKEPFAQPIIINCKNKLTFKTPIPKLFHLNMAHIFPFDRGINQNVKYTKKLAKMIIENNFE